jgi:hypothetical protein
MIVSVHIPKTAGSSFRADLLDVYGPRLLLDYGDWPEVSTPEADARHAASRAHVLARVASGPEDYAAIHGHFLVSKYLDVFPVTALVAMVRDPYQHAVSSYEHALRQGPSEHPGLQRFQRDGMTLTESIAVVPNHQSLFLRGVPIEEYAVIGVTEWYERSVALFSTMFGVTMRRTPARHNVNPAKAEGPYPISAEVRAAVDRHRAEDLALYRRARERFAALCARYGA